jgi:hypothetical protein
MSKNKEPFDHERADYGHGGRRDPYRPQGTGEEEERRNIAGPGGAGDLTLQDAPHRFYGQVPAGTEGRPMIDVIVCDLAASKFQRIDTGNRTIAGIIVSVTQGQLDVYLGEFTGVAPRVPHWHFTAIGRPVRLPLPKGRYVFTVFAGSTEALIGTITPIGGD